MISNIGEIEAAKDGDQNMQDAQNKTKRVTSRLLAKHAYNELFESNNVELFELKLPSSIRIQPVAYDSKEFQIEDPIVFKNDAGVLTERDCAVDNIIRYRITDKPGEINSLGLE